MGDDSIAPAPPLLPETFGAVELRRLAAELLRACGAPALSARLAVCWNPRLRSTAGRAFPKSWRIELNPRIQAHPGETDRTFRHELAHLLVAWEREQPSWSGRRRKHHEPHGAEWKQACARLGIRGESRCHQLPLAAPRRLARPHAYECPACLLVVRRARPIARGRMLACGVCCRQQARGRYDARFRLRQIDPAAPPPGLQGPSPS